MMKQHSDENTNGLEPDLALVKFKKLVGGGSMQIVNGTVPQVLRRLGYQEEQIEAVVAHIAENGNVIEETHVARGWTSPPCAVMGSITRRCRLVGPVLSAGRMIGCRPGGECL
jgi:hypothetical protein